MAYVIKKGDNLSTIAKNNGISLKDIINANSITDPNKIKVGDSLIIPQKNNSLNYTLKKGDNLSTLAKQNGLSLKDLLKLNPHIEDPDYIQVGQKINLPSQSPTGKQLYDNNDGYPISLSKKNTPTWEKTTKGAGNPAVVANFNKTPEKKVIIKKQVTSKREPSF